VNHTKIPQPYNAITAPPEKVILVGGPSAMPADLRVQITSPSQTTIKVSYYGGYEHFEREPDACADGLPVFRWTGRTKVAE